MAQPSSQELEFILRMRDEASRILKQFGSGAGGAGDQVENLAKRFDRLTRSARDFAVAVGGGGLVVGIGANTLRTFAEYETRMVAIAKTTNQTKSEMAEFEVQLDGAARALGGIQVADLQEVAQVAGQLGISGSQNLLKFSSTLNKLATASDVVGEEGASQIARILNLTKTPISEVGKFSDVLVHLGNNAAATESEILSLATLLSQATSKFDLGFENILGLSSGGAELGFKPELFASVIGRSLNQLENAAVNNTKAMRNFSEATGITADEFERLIKNDPTKAFDYFLQVMDATNRSGGSMQQFLQDWNLYAEENQRVLGTLAAQYDLRQKNLTLAKQQAAVPEGQGALNQEYERTLETLATKYKDFLDSVTLAQKEIGVAVKPAAVALLEGLTDTITELTGGFKELNPYMKNTLLTLGLVAATAIPAAAGVRLLGSAIQFALGANLLRGVATLGRLTPAMALATARTVGLRGALLGVGSIGGGIGVFYVLDQLKKKLEDAGMSAEEAETSINTFVGSGAVRTWLGIAQKTVNVATSDEGFEGFKAKSGINKAFTESQAMFDDYEKREREFIKKQDEKKGVFRTGELSVTPIKYLLEEYEISLQKLDVMRDQTDEVKKQGFALEALREISKTQKAGIGSSVSPDELSRLEELHKVAQRMADPFMQVTYELEKEQKAAGAITVEQQNQVELEQALLEIKEQKGRVLAEEEKKLKEVLAQTQKIRAAAAVADLNYNADQQLDVARTRSQLAREELEIQQQLANEIRNSTGENIEGLTEWTQKLREIAKINAFNTLEDRIDPIGAAIRSYADDMMRLNNALAEGLDPSRYQQLAAALERQTLGARDPLGFRVRDMRDEIEVLSFRGRQQEIERDVQSEINALREQNVILDKEGVAAIRQYVEAMHQIKQAQESGIAAWADDIGTVQEQIATLQENTADAISDGLTEGFASGDWKKAAASALQGLGKQFIKAGVDRFMADAIKKFGGDGGLQDGVNKASSAADILAGISKNGIAAATAIVNAGTVTVTGYAPADFIKGTPFEKIMTSKSGLPTPEVMGRTGSTIDFGRAAKGLSSMSGVGGGGGGNFEAMLRDAAMRHGIDPNVAVRVANAEGGLTSWQQSKVPGRIPGTFEPSYGPMQMLIGGPGTGYGKGMGNDFMAATGLDPRMASSAPQYFDFAMQHASKNGWGAWYGARDNGIGNMEGIGAIDTANLTNSIQQVNTQLGAAANAQNNFGTALQATSTASQTAQTGVLGLNNQLQTTTPPVTNFGTNVAGLQGPLQQATGGLGGFGQGLSQLFQGLTGGGQGGDGFNPLSLIGSIFGIFHEGGKVGGGGQLAFGHAGNWANAPRFHTGGGKGLNNDEYRALLKKNERVLTEDDDRRNMEVLRAKGRKGGAASQNVFAPTIPITVQASGNQETDAKMREALQAELDTLLENKMAEFTQREQRPGAMLNKKRFI